MYQVEGRPGWEWDRDYTRFNASMRDDDGRFAFDGPYCRISDWVDFSRDVAAADYHILEIKWHDGICYFDTTITDWKTDEDYALEFAELSRASGFPFMYYYSSVFDHNPQFDDIQLDPTVTPSFIGLRPEPEYIDYLLGQYREILDRYAPDGMWLDWYWADRSTRESIDFFREHPGTVLTFNLSSYYSTSFGRLHYTTGEAHTLDGPYVRLRRESSGVMVPVFSSVWKWSNLNRALLNHPWELITPAGKWWQDPSLRDDPLDLVRMAAIVMASGGKICPGLTSRMDGTIYPDQVKQLSILGDWYRPRKPLFTESSPLRYRLARVPGVRVSDRSVKTVCAFGRGEYILHLLSLTGVNGDMTVSFDGERWRSTDKVVIEPEGEELPLDERDGRRVLRIPLDLLDPADTILRVPAGAAG
jgi:alpha-L-fucosidase